MITVWPACSIKTDTRSRLSRGSSEMQVSQSQAIEGTPVDVPVPRKVSFMLVNGKPETGNGESKLNLCGLPFAVLPTAGDITGAELRRRRLGCAGKREVLH